MAVPVATPYRIYLTVIHTIAIACTIFRLNHRYRTRRLWWDDFWAASALLFDVLYFSTVWIPIDPADRRGAKPTRNEARLEAIVHFTQAQLFTFTLWSGRLSVVFSIIRILPPRSTMRRITIGVVIYFCFAWVGLFIQRFWICGELWGPDKRCRSLRLTGIAQLSADIIADILLTGIPIRMLWRTRLPNNQRILIMVIFASSLVITAMSILHNIYILRQKVIQLVTTAHLEAAVCVIVCNLLVVVTRIYCFLRHGEDLEAGTTEGIPSSPPLTTIVTEDPRPMTISFTDVSAIHTYDTDNQSSILDDSGNNITSATAGTGLAVLSSSSKNR